MKRILIVLAVIFSVHFADAQVAKTPEAAKNAVEKAEAAAANPKKAVKSATWLKLAGAYMDAYNAPVGAAWLGATKQDLEIAMVGETPISEESAILAGEPYTKVVYAAKNLYFNQAGQLALIYVTKPVFEDALEGARAAYAKAAELDVKGAKKEEISKAIANVAKKYLDDGMNEYLFENYAVASVLFGKAAAASETAPYSTVDTTALYNAGFTAWMVKDYQRAKEYFEKCIAVGYYYDDGEVFAKLADIHTNMDNKEAARDVLEDGFTKYPQSQSILIGLINYYLTNNENPNRLFELIGLAKKNEPNNASLYYVEGNIYNELRKADPANAEEYIKKAIAAYDDCSALNPSYEFGHIGKGILYYNLAIDLQEQAQNELDDAKWAELNEKFAEALKAAREPFESAYSITKDDALKVNIAEYLKNIYYRFSSDSDEYMEGYKKYDEIVKTGKPL